MKKVSLAILVILSIVNIMPQWVWGEEQNSIMLMRLLNQFSFMKQTGVDLMQVIIGLNGGVHVM